MGKFLLYKCLLDLANCQVKRETNILRALSKELEIKENLQKGVQNSIKRS